MVSNLVLLPGSNATEKNKREISSRVFFFLNHTAGQFFISAEGVVSQFPQPCIPVSGTSFCKPYNLTLSFLMERKMTPDRISRALSNPIFLVI